MPRPWSDYTLREWLRITPFEQRYNYLLYQLRARPLAWRAPERGDVAAVRTALRDRRVLVTVAFNDPAFIDWQARLVRQNVGGCEHLIIDNSSDGEAARAIEAVAARRGLRYLKLKPPPWRSAIDGGKAHAAAMNWTWRNVLRAAGPAAFGFIDHDIFPMRPTDPFAALDDHRVAGLVRNKIGAARWCLWAGFCFFRYDAVSSLRLDFSLDWTAGLDTGGANWFVLYRRLAPGEVFDTGMAPEPINADADVPPEGRPRFEWLGDWLHFSNFSTPHDLAPARRMALMRQKRRLLMNYLHLAVRGAAQVSSP